MNWRGHLVENPFGALSIWEPPVPGLMYSVGVDTSSGVKESVKEGDPSAAVVVEMRTCRQVAEMHGYMDPTHWGFAVARLAGHYNMAPLAIETSPSPHGLAAYIAAERYPYPNLWMQQRLEQVNGRTLERRGWTRNAGTTMHLFNRIREALQEGCIIRSARLLDELSAVRLEEGKPKSTEHDDCIVAYGIALMVRDQSFMLGEIKKAEPAIRDLADAHWRRQAELVASPDTPEKDDVDDCWDGT